MSHPLPSAVHPAAPMRRNHPMAWAIAVALGSMVAPASQAQQAFSPGWFAERGAAQGSAAQSGRMPNGVPIQFQLPAQQQDAARQKLQQSIDNLGTAAQAIALQQRLQEQARQARREAGFIVADGLGKDGLSVDQNPLTRGWLNARDAIQSQGSDGRVQVTVEQTADKAILNWETFNIGGNTTLNFLQNPDWAVLNRVNDPQARPSQILGQLKANGTVFVANRNGVVFGNNSQVNVRNLLAAAARISDAQFRDNGLYSPDASSSALSDAFGKVMVEQGARIATHEPTSATRGGGYVLLAGHSVENAGHIEARKGQVQLAAGDSFVIRRGVGTATNTSSTTRGNEIAPRFVAGSTAGSVRNTGLLRAREGDVTWPGATSSRPVWPWPAPRWRSAAPCIFWLRPVMPAAASRLPMEPPRRCWSRTMARPRCWIRSATASSRSRQSRTRSAPARARQPSTICPSTMIAGTSRGWRSSRVATSISVRIR